MLDFNKNKKTTPSDSGNIVFEKLESNVNLNEEPATIHTMKDDLDAMGYSAENKKEGPKKTDIQPRETSTPKPPLPPDRDITEKTAEEKPAIEQSKGVMDEQKSYSPFLNASPPKKPTYEPKEEEKKPSRKDVKWGKILFASIVVVAILALAAGGYYFWITRKTPALPPIEEPPIEEPVIVEEPQGKYNTDSPNYLLVDTEKNFTPSAIQELLLNTGSEIKEENISEPVEFIITDTDNDPVAFSIFSILLDLKLSPVLDSLDEEFSLFIYPDSDNIRLGLAVNVKDKDQIIATLTIKENTLINDLTPLFLNVTPEITSKAFQDSQYKNFDIRFVNLDTGETISVDYTLSEDQLIVGTSKNTIRAVIDKISAE